MRLGPGKRSDYALDPKPLGRGGYADVFGATHKPTRERVAFKRLHNMLGDARDRMRREISVMVDLNGTPEIMPILDADKGHEWYVMPLADGDLVKLRKTLDDGDLVVVAGDAAAGLHAAHARGLVHRDVTPRNLLRLPNGTWVVADWGVVRRPLGQTTRRLTELDKPLGTEGFIAPEVFRDAHRAPSAKADVFSLGQVLNWAVSGRWPLAGERNPPEGPWRSWVRDAIKLEPRDRPTLPELIQRLDEVAYVPDERLPERVAALATLAREGDIAAARKVLEIADERHEDSEIFFDHLPSARGAVLEELVRDEQMAERLITAMRDRLSENDWGYRNFDQYNSVLGWLHNVADAAELAGRIGVLEDAADALFTNNWRFDRWREKDRCKKWLVGLDGEAAKAVARALRRHPDAAQWLMEDWNPTRAEPIILDALDVPDR